MKPISLEKAQSLLKCNSVKTGILALLSLTETQLSSEYSKPCMIKILRKKKTPKRYTGRYLIQTRKVTVKTVGRIRGAQKRTTSISYFATTSMKPRNPMMHLPKRKRTNSMPYSEKLKKVKMSCHRIVPQKCGYQKIKRNLRLLRKSTKKSRRFYQRAQLNRPSTRSSPDV